MPLFPLSTQTQQVASATMANETGRAEPPRPETRKKISANQTPLSSQPYTSMGGYRHPHDSPAAPPACPPSPRHQLPVIGASLHRCNDNLHAPILHPSKAVHTHSLIVAALLPTDSTNSTHTTHTTNQPPPRQPSPRIPASSARKIKFSPSARPPTQYFRPNIA